MIALTSALTANLCVSLMRFTALLVSATLVNAPPFPPRTLFASGSLAILGGSLLYSFASQAPPGGTGRVLKF